MIDTSAHSASWPGGSTGAGDPFLSRLGAKFRCHSRSRAAAKAAVSVRADLEVLERHQPARLHAAKVAWLESIERRLNAEALSGPARKTLYAELALIACEAKIAREPYDRGARSLLTRRADTRPTTGGPKQLMRARVAFAKALYAELCAEGNPTRVLGRRLAEAVKLDPAAGSALLNALDAMGRSGDAEIVTFAETLSHALTMQAHWVQCASGASRSVREAARLPNDVLVHLAVLVDDELGRSPSDPVLTALAADARSMFLRHQVSADGVAAMAERLARHVGRIDADAAARVRALVKDLPAADTGAGGRRTLNRTQQHDNFSGRVFDSRLIQALVDQPPSAAMKAVAAVGRALADDLQDDELTRNAVKSVQEHFIQDPRGWEPMVPGFQALLKAPPDEAVARLKAFLGAPATSGPDAIARQLLMIQVGLHLGKQAHAAQQPERTPPFMAAADPLYNNELKPQALRDVVGLVGWMSPRRGAGIHLRHQPVAADDIRLQPAHRPASYYRAGTREPADSVSPDRSDALAVFSRAHDVQHAHALPVGAGVSGSTNLLLYLFATLRDAGRLPEVDAREFLLATAMTMTYDGGHSVHEVLWTANRLDVDLGLGLGLGLGLSGGRQPEDFVSDYERLASGFNGATKEAVAQALQTAWLGTAEHFRKHSHFANLPA